MQAPGACQWSGVAIKIASTFLSSNIFLTSFSNLGLSDEILEKAIAAFSL